MKKKTGQYKTARKHKCPFCDERMTRGDLILHVEEEHEMMIPEGYNATRCVYDSINGKNYGTCMVCKSKVYEWDDRICRYKNLCKNPKCRKAVQDKARGNNLDDPEKQIKMLAGRRISGTYKFQDGVVHSYTGSYEESAWEFMDKVMNIPGADLMVPGPVIDYEFEGENHKWILDCLYIPAMLAMDIKDGGSNPNTRPMQSYREKQVAKENAIIKHGDYNYIRLTDNNFSQLLEALADIKFNIMEHDPEKGIYINESGTAATGGVMVGTMSGGSSYVIPHGFKGMNSEDIEGFAFGNTNLDKIFRFDKDDNLIMEDTNEFLSGRNHKYIVFTNPRDIDTCKGRLTESNLLELYLGFPYTSMTDFLFCEDACILNVSPINHFRSKGIVREAREYAGRVVLEQLIKTVGSVSVMSNDEGFFCVTPSDYYLVSPTFNTLDDITDDTIKLMNDLYTKNKEEGPIHGNGNLD